MAHAIFGIDPVRRLQLEVSRLLRRSSFETTRLDGVDQEARDSHYRSGAAQVKRIGERIEASTGFSLDGARALDFGCGLGRALLPLAERCEHVYGLDISPAVLREAETEATRRGLTNIDLMGPERLGELAGKYDLVVSFFVFQHIPSREGERILATLLGGLRPGGAGAIHLTFSPRPRRAMHLYAYERINSYSLNRLAKVFSDASITEWHARIPPRPSSGAQRDVTLIFRKKL